MPLLGEQVTPALPRRGRLALPAVLGGLWGWFILRRFEYTPTRLQGGFLGMSGDWLWMALVVSPVVLWLLLFTRVEQRVRLVAVVGAITTFVGAVALRVWFHLREPALGIDSPWWFSWSSLVMPLAIALSGVVLGLVALAFSRVVLGRAVRQTNPARLCWGCGYDLGTPPAAKCPECGRGFSAVCERPLWIWRVVNVGQRATRPVFVLMLVVLGVVLTHRIVTEVVPARAFLGRFGKEARFNGTVICPVQAGMSLRSSERLPIEGSLSRVVSSPQLNAGFLVILTLDSAPALRVWAVKDIDWRKRAAPQYPVYLWPTTPVAALTPAQTTRVLRDGLPPTMLRAMRQRAMRQRANAPNGPIRAGGYRSAIIEEPFDPTPYFPPDN